MDVRPCIVCKVPVDTDNGFGHIADEDVYCEKHSELRRIGDEFKDVRKKIKELQIKSTQLQNQYNETAARTTGKIFNFVRRHITITGYVIEAKQKPKKGKQIPQTVLKIHFPQIPQNDFDDLCRSMGGAPDAEVTLHMKVEKIDKKTVEGTGGAGGASHAICTVCGKFDGTVIEVRKHEFNNHYEIVLNRFDGDKNKLQQWLDLKE